VLAAEQRARLQITAVNRAAERAGFRPGMTLADARAILPGLAVRPADPAGDAKALARLARWCGRYSPLTSAEETSDSYPGEALDAPRIEAGGGAGIWLDSTGCDHLFGGEEAMLTDMTERLGELGFSARAALAGTPGCAWAVARYTPDRVSWVVVPPAGERDALSPLPVTALGIGPAMAAELHGLGLKRIGDVLALPRASLAARFGETLRARLDAALGKNAAAEPISPFLPEAPLAARLAFAEPIGTVDDIAAATQHLLKTLCQRLERAGQGARQLALTAFRPDGSTARLVIGTGRANRDPDRLFLLFAERLAEIDTGFGIDEITLAAIHHESTSPAQTGLGSERARAESLDALIDLLANRLGPQTVRRPALRESHLPERAAGLVPSSEASLSSADARSPNPRPVRLLRPPEPVETVSEEPDGPPHLFRWRRVLHRVILCEGPERIAPEWWREEKTEAGIRDYFRVEDDGGGRFWLYREDCGEVPRPWFLHGLFG